MAGVTIDCDTKNTVVDQPASRRIHELCAESAETAAVCLTPIPYYFISTVRAIKNGNLSNTTAFY